jgi:predicted amidohydrolase
MASYRLQNQTASVQTLFPQLDEGDVLAVSFAGSGSAAFLREPDQGKLEHLIASTRGRGVTFYGVPAAEASLL